MEDKRVYKLLIFMYYFLFLTITILVDIWSKRFFSILGIVFMIHLTIKMIMAAIYKPNNLEMPKCSVAVIIPMYNESEVAIKKTIESILNQSYIVDELYIVDDGSMCENAYLEAVHIAEEYMKCNEKPRIITHRFKNNLGKRRAQAWGFSRSKCDIFVTIDSDTILLKDAMKELIRPFSDETVMASSAHTNVQNRSENLLVKLVDMRFECIYRTTRAAQSVTGAVIIACGTLSAYRARIVKENLHYYVTQTFLGEEARVGDDRCLTNFALREGKSVYQSTSKCLTDMPNNLKKFSKQQLRWSRSFLREARFSLKTGIDKKKFSVFYWILMDGLALLWLLSCFTIILVSIVFSRVVLISLIIPTILHMIVFSYAQNATYILENPYMVMISPLYSLLYMVLLAPIRIYSVFRPLQRGWGTR